MRCTASMQGTWTCGVFSNCDLVVPNDSAASLVVMLRLLRIFRILWIFKNFNVLSISTVLGRLQVSACVWCCGTWGTVETYRP